MDLAALTGNDKLAELDGPEKEAPSIQTRYQETVAAMLQEQTGSVSIFQAINDPAASGSLDPQIRTTLGQGISEGDILPAIAQVVLNITRRAAHELESAYAAERAELEQAISAYQRRISALEPQLVTLSQQLEAVDQSLAALPLEWEAALLAARENEILDTRSRLVDLANGVLLDLLASVLTKTKITRRLIDKLSLDNIRQQIDQALRSLTAFSDEYDLPAQIPVSIRGHTAADQFEAGENDIITRIIENPDFEHYAAAIEQWLRGKEDDEITAVVMIEARVSDLIAACTSILSGELGDLCLTREAQINQLIRQAISDQEQSPIVRALLFAACLQVQPAQDELIWKPGQEITLEQAAGQIARHVVEELTGADQLPDMPDAIRSELADPLLVQQADLRERKTTGESQLAETTDRLTQVNEALSHFPTTGQVQSALDQAARETVSQAISDQALEDLLLEPCHAQLLPDHPLRAYLVSLFEYIEDPGRIENFLVGYCFSDAIAETGEAYRLIGMQALESNTTIMYSIDSGREIGVLQRFRDTEHDRDLYALRTSSGSNMIVTAAELRSIQDLLPQQAQQVLSINTLLLEVREQTTAEFRAALEAEAAAPEQPATPSPEPDPEAAPDSDIDLADLGRLRDALDQALAEYGNYHVLDADGTERSDGSDLLIIETETGFDAVWALPPGRDVRVVAFIRDLGLDENFTRDWKGLAHLLPGAQFSHVKAGSSEVQSSPAAQAAEAEDQDDTSEEGMPDWSALQTELGQFLAKTGYRLEPDPDLSSLTDDEDFVLFIQDGRLRGAWRMPAQASPVACVRRIGADPSDLPPRIEKILKAGGYW